MNKVGLGLVGVGGPSLHAFNETYQEDSARAVFSLGFVKTKGSWAPQLQHFRGPAQFFSVLINCLSWKSSCSVKRLNDYVKTHEIFHNNVNKV